MITSRSEGSFAPVAWWFKYFLLILWLLWLFSMWESFAPHTWEALGYAFCRGVWMFSQVIGKPLQHGNPLSDRLLDTLAAHASLWDRKVVAITELAFFWAFVFASIVLWLRGPGGYREEHYLRGASMLDAQALNRLTRVPRWQWWRRSERTRQLYLGGVAVPIEIENENFLLSGRPKTGKSLSLKGMAIGIRRRGDRALVADPDGAFLAAFARDGDELLNPFDARSSQWSPFCEIESDFHHELLARAIIADGTGSDAEWRLYAQQLYAAVSRRLVARGMATTDRLIYFLCQASPKELGELIKDDIAAQIAEKGNEKMFSNTRAVLAMVLGSWRFLPPGGSFSVRRWVREGRGWLFFNYRDDQWAALRPLVSAWIYLAISEGLTLTPNGSRRLWYLLDELASLERIGNLEDGANKLRKHGGCIVGCVQAIAQLRERYGLNTAQSILSSFGTWLVLGTGDGETAEVMANHIGEEEIELYTLSVTRGHDVSTSESFGRETRPLILASQIRKLFPREGFLDLAGSYPTARIVVPDAHVVEAVPSFIPPSNER